MFYLLPNLVAHLQLIFVEKQRIDFVEMALHAARALGNMDSVSDLTLSLDYRLQHILVDEFQDTSNTQFQLFESLVSGWEAGDGRTIFLVGDPMQSIYRFRGAEVALFYQVQERGIGSVRCTPLSLKQNFRSGSDLVQGVNQLFSQRMRRFSIAEPATDAKSGQLEYRAFEDAWSEAVYLADSIAELKKAEPECSIAVLGRARGHLQPALKALKQSAIPFVSYDLDTLEQNACVRDLLTLLQAVLDWNHRLSWVALLRSPLIGLNLSDCTVLLAAFDHQQASEPLAKGLWLGWESLALSEYALQRLSYVVPIFDRWIEQYQAESLFLWLKSLWIALGGPAAYMPAVLSSAPLFFRALEQETWKTLDHPRFERELLARFDNRLPDNAHAVQVMTIHKAKGLEFDYVFLLACHKQVAQDSKTLIRWMEYPSKRGGVDWVLAPIPAYGSEVDPIYGYLAFLEKNKAEEEMVRLFYVGVTRAKKACFMSQYGAQSRSFQSLLEGIMEPTLCAERAFLLPEAFDGPKKWFRLSSSWQAPLALKEAMLLEKPIEIDAQNAQWQRMGYEYNAKKALDEGAAFGTAVHFLLEMMAKQVFSTWFDRMQHRTLDAWRMWLESMGVSCPSYHAVFIEWLKETPNDERLQWILAPHEKAHNEWVLCHSLGRHSIQRQVIDRSFVADGIRWIIDYKTGDVARDKQEGHWEGYVSQLDGYVKLVAQLQEPFPIQAALYYPLSKTWCLITV